MTRPRLDIPIDYLRECLDYDPLTGILTWKHRPREHFADDWQYRRWSERFAERKTGFPTGTGHLKVCITIDGKANYIKVHRAAWALMTGTWPKDEIDHVNRRGADNRWVNLREATNAENSQNRKIASSNASGFCGVSWYKKASKWGAKIKVGHHDHFLGLFTTPEAAHTAYLEAKTRLHPFYSGGGS
jgi:hypothetical protein